MRISLFDHPLLGGLVGDEEVAQHFTLEAEFKAIEQFELVLAKVSAEFKLIPKGAVSAITKKLDKFAPDLKRLIDASARDGVIIPDLIAQMRAEIGGPHDKHLHLGATSQDVIDTSLAMRLVPVFNIIEERLSRVVSAIESLSIGFAGNQVMARTRMQNAFEIEASDRIEAWRDLVVSVLERLPAVKSGVLRVQLGGAVGTRHQLGGKGAEIAERMGEELNLDGSGPVWHTNRVGMADFANWLSLVTGTLGKIGQDITLMAQNDIAEISFKNAGTSSAMPHKQNPVGAEILVTLARFNATQVSGMHHTLVHENERSGAAWTLEWMILPQMVVAAAGSLKRAENLFADVESFGG